ncbi:cobalamin biosynthesis protein CbiX [bacterium]|nr:cobalamin biosynthesis protein CbiX [bacterium]
MSTAVLLIAHGSRRLEANQDLVAVAEALRTTDEYDLVVPSYLELAEPSIPDGARKCVELGASEVRMLPYFLSAGSHVTRDLERFRNDLAAEFPAVSFKLCPPLGLHPLMLDIIRDRLRETQNGTSCRVSD